MKNQLVFFIDVDDTFVRSYGNKRVPIPVVIEHLKKLYQEGADLYCWSSGGADYAQKSAAEFGIENIFTNYLPKPQVIIDDMKVNNWRKLLQVHPNSCVSMELEDYEKTLKNK